MNHFYGYNYPAGCPCNTHPFGFIIPPVTQNHPFGFIIPSVPQNQPCGFIIPSVPQNQRCGFIIPSVPQNQYAQQTAGAPCGDMVDMQKTYLLNQQQMLLQVQTQVNNALKQIEEALAGMSQPDKTEKK